MVMSTRYSARFTLVNPSSSRVSNLTGRNFEMTAMFVRACMLIFSAVKEPAPASAIGSNN